MEKQDLAMFTIFLFLFFTAALSEKTVKYAAVIYRHGDRTPVDTYPTDPYRNESLWPVKFGQLTNTGKKQHYAFGEWLRDRYSYMLSEEFKPDQVRVQSTDVDRTIMSAEVNNAGLFPPTGDAVWNNKILWQPIPIHTKPEKDDEVLAMKKKCPAYDKEMKEAVSSPEYQSRLMKYQPLMNYLEAKTGKPIKDYYDIVDIYSILYIETLYNFTLPDWTKDYFPDKLKEPACYSFYTTAMTPTLARLRAGPLLKDIMSHVNKAINNQSYPLKLSIYSGHDLTIGTILTALKIFDFNCPVYTSAIFFELIEDSATRKHYISISYRNTTYNAEPTVMFIPYCGTLCLVERFKQLYGNLLNVNFNEDCKITKNSFKFPIFLTMSAGAILLLLSSFAAYVFRGQNASTDGSRSSRRKYRTNILLSNFNYKTDSV